MKTKEQVVVELARSVGLTPGQCEAILNELKQMANRSAEDIFKILGLTPLADTMKQPEDTGTPVSVSAEAKSIIFQCQSCGESVEAPAELASMNAECPFCSKTIKVPSAPESPVAQDPSTNPVQGATNMSGHEELSKTIRIDLPDNVPSPREEVEKKKVSIKRASR